ncbi:hypothetical protein INQ51_08045 [Maribellus sp. CM-23]|uniref:hypothetical protein n=1 Tax=Maribellus sp. CM-23 TaxID=2781026 RepID=UPI001F19E4E8|nr:hypothetical protein [Maribellus sp. CM-23]MCE4564261.1 hypothetical protein [Maribellus sp. CM-23]
MERLRLLQFLIHTAGYSHRPSVAGRIVYPRLLMFHPSRVKSKLTLKVSNVNNPVRSAG